MGQEGRPDDARKSSKNPKAGSKRKKSGSSLLTKEQIELLEKGPTVLDRRFNSPFVLDRLKLSRILTIIERKFVEARLQISSIFKIDLSSGKRISTSSEDHLLALNNTLRDPIEGLTISVISIEKDRLGTECYISLLATEVTLSVSSYDSEFSKSLFEELEGQIKRTLARSLVHRSIFKIIGPFGRSQARVIFIFLSFYLLLILAGFFQNTSNQALLLTKDEVQYFVSRSQQVNSTNEKVDFLFELENKQLSRMRPWSETPTWGKTLIGIESNTRTLFIVLPLFTIIACFSYLIGWCYPGAVFLWGDYEVYYRNLLSKRKAVWTVVILSSMLGALSSLFVLSVSSYL